MSYWEDYGYYDTKILSTWVPEIYMKDSCKEDVEVTTKLMAKTWLQEKQASAVLESHRERVRQVLAEMSKVDSSVWAQGLAYVQNAQSADALKKVCDSFDIVWKDSGDMNTKNVEIALLKTEVDKLNAKIKKLQFGRFGEEPSNGAVFKIERRFEQYGKGYTYAAVRAGGSWFLTGTRGDAVKEMSWEQLKTWAGKYSRVWKMTVAEEMVD